MLILDTNVADHDFHDVTLLDMAEAVGSALTVGGGLDSPATAVSSFGSVKHDMARHVASFHIDFLSYPPRPSCGGARCHGAPSGRALHRTVSITYTRNILCQIP